jgi:hypothetical protein
MKRVTNALLGMVSLLALVPVGFSQDGTPQPCPAVAPGTLGCELVEWSQLQDPVPLPEPDAKPVPPPHRQHDPQPGQSANPQAQPQSPRQSMSGPTTRGRHCLEVSPLLPALAATPRRLLRTSRIFNVFIFYPAGSPLSQSDLGYCPEPRTAPSYNPTWRKVLQEVAFARTEIANCRSGVSESNISPRYPRNPLQ